MAAGFCTYEDITERRKAEARIEFLAHHDGLTELPNRVLFTERLEVAISQASADAPLCVALSRPRRIQERQRQARTRRGRSAVEDRPRGDCTTACATTIPARDWGGDEFAIVLPGVSAGGCASHRASDHRSAPAPTTISGHSARPKSAPASGSPAHPIMQPPATSFCWWRTGRSISRRRAKLGVPALFDEGLETRDATVTDLAQIPRLSLVEGGRGGDDLRALANDLAEALRNDSLFLHYQPIYDAASGRPVVFEALARWNAPHRGSVSPMQFVRAAEQFGLIGALTEWVLSSACKEASRWKQPLQVSVNLSPLNLRDPSLVPTVARILGETGLCAVQGSCSNSPKVRSSTARRR